MRKIMLEKISTYICLILAIANIGHAKKLQPKNELQQLTYIKASNTDAFDVFGTTIALSGNTLVVGAWGEASSAVGMNGDSGDNSARSSGAVYVFVRTNAGFWTQQAYLKAANTDARDNFGSSVAISGDTIVVGARYEDSNATGVNGDANNNLAGDSGAAYVFVRSGTIWTQQAYLKASNTGIGDHFGTSVAISDDTIIVGARSEDSNATGINGDGINDSAIESGAAYVFVRSGTTWSQQAYLKASNTDEEDAFGSAVAISGNTAVVAAVLEDSDARGINLDEENNSAKYSGAAYIFVRNGNNWSQQAYVKSANSDTYDFFGTAVDISNDTVVISAKSEDSNATGINGDASNNSAKSSGATYVFTRTGTNWSQQAYIKASNTHRDYWFGSSVAILDDVLIVGSRLESSNGIGVGGSQDYSPDSFGQSGSAYYFVRTGNNWNQVAYLKASNTGGQDFFGITVAIAPDILAVGAHNETSAAIGINGDDEDNTLVRAGAVYTYSSEGIDLIFANGFEN